MGSGAEVLELLGASLVVAVVVAAGPVIKNMTITTGCMVYGIVY